MASLGVPWLDMIKLVAGMLYDICTEPPIAWQGRFTTAKGNQYLIKKIPNAIPAELSITLWLPWMAIPIVYVRHFWFDDKDGLERLLRHEGVHVDQWKKMGQDKFLLNYAQHKKRRNIEAEAYAENVLYKVQDNKFTYYSAVFEPAGTCDVPLDYWMLYYAAKIDQFYHIRGSGIRSAYLDLKKWVEQKSDLQPKSWEQVVQYKDYFKPKKRKS